MATIHVPKFGNFDEDEDVPYTQFFDTARIDKVGGKLFNPNDPCENPGVFPGLSSPINPHLTGRKSHPEAHMVVQQKQMEYGAARRHPTAVLIQNEALTRMPADKQKEDGKTTGVSNVLRNHEKLGDEGESLSPTLERKKISSDGSVVLSPTKPKKKIVRRKSGSSELGSMVPKGGEWDESDPSSADGYTHVFEKVREEHSSATTTTNVSVKSDSSRLPALGRDKADRDTSPKAAPCYCCFSARN